jgi:hypothetical protein
MAITIKQALTGIDIIVTITLNKKLIKCIINVILKVPSNC